MTANKVDLIPWDPTDEKQYQRMYDQRVACGWRAEEVGKWKTKQLKGVKFLYWMVLSGNLPGRDKLLADHLERFTAEREPIVDTAKSVGHAPRTPTGQSFIPIGHTALELVPECDRRFSLPRSTIWVKSLYVSWALQSGGFGRSAMAQTERLAGLAPHNATVVALDTVQGEFQLSERHLQALYDGRGMDRPANLRSNQEWYSRQGYEIMPTGEGEQDYYPWKVEATGEMMNLPVVWMKKAIA